LPEARWNKPTGITSQRNGLQNDIAKALYHHANANLFDRLIIVAPPKILGQLRQAFHAEVIDRIATEIPKELTSHPVSEIGKLVAG
jgi:protein required for attachment to host cells